ncbi:MAG TPA: hypothetical protein VFB54_10635 [Burkholderiales bacterium]|nr:hypothetical protein [Burkholderiales bacterium]
MTSPLVLDLDASLSPSDARRVDLRHWQEAIRFACRTATWREFERDLQTRAPAIDGTVLLGSGDFHHVSALLIKRLARSHRFDVLVCDNHPDNMRFPFGIHCGSWVRHVAALPQVGIVHVVGITSRDVAAAQAWQNYLRPLYARRVCYWTVGVNTRWAARLGLSESVKSFGNCAALVRALTRFLRATTTPLYLSIDKDVLADDVVQTNWDQGCMRLAQLEAIIAATQGRVIGSDITGEVSSHRYRSRWKRLLSAIDHQPSVDPGLLRASRAAHCAVNRHLLDCIATAAIKPAPTRAE